MISKTPYKIPSNTKLEIFSKGVFEKYWVTIDGVKYLFKTNDTNSPHHLGQRNAEGEAIVGYFAKKLGFPCVETKFAVCPQLENKEGVLIKSYLTDGVTETFSFNELYEYRKNKDEEYPVCDALNIDDIMAILKNFESDTIKLSPDIKLNLQYMCFVDFVFEQFDRHGNNIEFLLKVKPDLKMELSLAPMFDNGMIYLLNNNIFLVKNILKEENLIDYYKDTQSYKLCPHRMDKLQKEDLQSEEYLSKYTEQIAKLVVEVPLIRELYNKFKACNFKKTVYEAEEENGINLDEEYNYTMLNFYKYKMSQLTRKVNKLDEINSNNAIQNSAEKVKNALTKVTKKETNLLDSSVDSK